jgi:hypothetical protein
MLRLGSLQLGCKVFGKMPFLDLDLLEIDLASFAKLRDGFGESWSSADLLGHSLLGNTHSGRRR